MRLRLTLLLSLLALATADAQFLQHRRKSFLATGVTYILNENFEGTGTPASWSGPANFDSTTSPLAGAQSLRMVANSAVGPTFDNGNFYMKFMFRVSALPASDYEFVTLADSSFNDMLQVYLLTTGELVVADNSSTIFSFTSSTMSASTTYFVWIDYIKGTGSNATCKVYFNTTDSKPTFGAANTAGGTNGTSSANIGLMFLQYSGTADMDNVQAAITPF